ncbi:MAG: phosphate ABC transporter permease subunit PstC [Sulfolobales archaeon]
MDFFKYFSITNILVVLILVIIVVILIFYSYPIFLAEGLRFFFTSTWDPMRDNYGILFAIGGTLVTSFITVIIVLVTSISAAVFMIEITPYRFRPFLEAFIDLAATIPSVIYGLWGVFVLAPFLRDYIMRPLLETFPWLAEFTGRYVGSGTSIFTASILLAIMTHPFATSVIKESLKSIPQSIIEALYSLGLTRWEIIKHKILMIRFSIIAGILLALGRAMGETVAVAMVVGNVVNPYFYKIFTPGYTISSLIANQFLSAAGLAVSALYGASLFILLVGFVINILVMIYMKRSRVK